MGNFENIWKKALPVAVALVLFGVVAIAGFGPQLTGKVLPQHDIQQFDGMSRDIRECRDKFDEDPQWTGAMFSGMPAYQINIKYPSQIIKRSADAVQSVFDGPASMIFLAMLSAFVMAVMMGMSAWIGIIVGLAYGLSTYFFLIIGAGHITKMWALVYAPAMLGAIHYTLRRNMWVGGALTALFAALEIGANHLQITYYFLFAAIALYISEVVFAIIEKRFLDFTKRTAILVGAAVLAIGANFAPLYYTQQHTEDTTRGGSVVASEGNEGGLDSKYITDWSYGIGESWNMLMPNLMGGDSGDGNTFDKDGVVAEAVKTTAQEGGYTKAEANKLAKQYAKQLPTYWGEQPYTAGPTYLGAVVIFLALLGLLLAENRDRWWILAVSVLVILMAWGRHAMWFTDLCIDYLPLYDKFRTVSTALVVVEWTIPLLAGLALWQIYKHWEDKKRLTKSILISGGITGGICLLFAIGATIIHDTWICDFGVESGINMAGYEIGEAMAAERRYMLIFDAVRSFILILLGAGILYAALRVSSKWRLAFLGGLALLVVVDILPVNLRYMPYDKFVEPKNNKVRPTSADKEIMKDTEPGYRVFNASVSTFNDATTSMFHRSVGGYHGAKLGRYQDIIDYYFTGDKDYMPILNMLNTKYFIVPKTVTTPGGEQQLDPSGKCEAQENPYRLGAAWFVRDIQVVDDAKAELEALGKVNLQSTAVVEKGTTSEVKDTSGKVVQDIQLVEYRPNYLRYTYKLEGGSGVAVFSEIYFDKGWEVKIDGKPAKSFRADYLLRAMELPEGEHTIEWRFEAPRWTMTWVITFISSILILLALGAIVTIAIYNYVKKK